MEAPMTTKLERGCVVTILVTIILLARPIGVFVQDLYRKDGASALVSGGLAGLICLVGWLLWTGGQTYCAAYDR